MKCIGSEQNHTETHMWNIEAFQRINGEVKARLLTQGQNIY